MKGKVIWLLASCVVVLSLILAACAPAAPPAEKAPAAPAEVKPAAPAGGELVPAQKEAVAAEGGEEMVKWTGKKLDGTVVEKWVEKAKYGGVFTAAVASDSAQFDGASQGDFGSIALEMTNDALIYFDWARGMAGTEEASWMDSGWPIFEYETGGIAESWEAVDDTTVIYHIRKGIRWHNKPPANGRELTAQDVAASLIRHWKDPMNYLGGMLPYATTYDSITTPDKWTVVVKVKPPLDNLSEVVREMNSLLLIFNRDVWEKGLDPKDWRNNLGTGPFLLKDYVPGTSYTLVRNPNYWMKDPIETENTLPYLDGVKALVIPDISTRVAALRTGKIEALYDTSGTGTTNKLYKEDAEALMKTNPELKWRMQENFWPLMVWWRTDLKPFSDVRVRRALHMAANLPDIKDHYYDGKGSYLSLWVSSITAFDYIYQRLEELPASVQELYTDNPTKAKQLLAEAGYPNGFKTTVLATQDDVSLLSVIKANWARIGVELAIDVRDSGAKGSMQRAKNFEMITGTDASTSPFSFSRTYPGTYQDIPMIRGSGMEELRSAATRIYMFEKDPLVRRQKLAAIYKPWVAKALDQAYSLDLPTTMRYSFWQPWLKGYNGEGWLGYWLPHRFIPMTWIDVDLKQKMTGR